ncbi:MAG: hypothetical protein B7Y91_00710 [Rhodobacterales bacterium 32-64-14]|nr:MAG: hypothetical protein B7Y91_00710 [Rhodobacterales bacterium 32-64-14]
MTQGLIARAIFYFLIAAAAVSSPARSQTADPDQLVAQAKVAPDIVGAGGEYTYTFDFDLPEFRGLVPDLRLSYNSSDISRGGSDNFVAFGWRLSGLSRIERESVGGGVPTFDDGQDIYRLDGAELMACNDTAATNKWTRKYPLRYLTTVSSASCSAGGNLSTRVESYNRIVYDQAVNEFLVTRPDGRRYRYQAVGVLAGDTSTQGDLYKMAHQSRWVLTEIRDTQKDAAGNYKNVVKIEWVIGGSGNGFPELPRAIHYAPNDNSGYNVWLNYVTAAAPVAYFGTGTATLGKQYMQLTSVVVRDGTEPIRAYNLVRTPSALTGTALLEKVESYGSDFVDTNSVVSGPSKLPDVAFQYSADTYAVTQKTYTGKEFHSHHIAGDWDYSGKDDLVLLGGKLRYTHEGGGQGGNITFPIFHTLSSARYRFDPQQNITAEPAIIDACDGASTVQYGNNFPAGEFLDEVPSPHDLLSNDRTGTDHLCLRTDFSYTLVGNAENPRWGHTVVTSRISSSTPTQLDTLVFNSASSDAWNGALTDLDLDPNPEGIFGAPGVSLYDIDGGQISLVSALSSSVWDTARILADFTGDGVSDFAIFQSGKFASSTSNTLYRMIFEQGYWAGVLNNRGQLKSLSTVPLATGVLPAVGDFNGDGLNDLVGYKSSGGSAYTVTVRYGTGSGFTTATTFNLGNLGTSNDTMVLRTEDINEDGLADIILHQGVGLLTGTVPSTWAPSTPYVSKPAHVLLNTGAGFAIQTLNGSTSVAHYVGHGDFDGDGLTDFVIEGADGKILFGTSPVPNRLVKVTDQRGGVTEVTYRPSAQQPSVSGGNQIPVVQQLVDTITVKDGRGNSRTTTYTYANGKYDFVNRKALGYDTVTATLAALPGEANPPVVTTMYLNNNFVDAGLVQSRIVSTGGTLTWAKEINDWQVLQGGAVQSFTANTAPEAGGPFKVLKLSERVASLYDDQLIETMKAFTWTAHGELATVIDYGFSSNGSNLAGGDNSVTTIQYQPNLTDYIVDRPKLKWTQAGTVSVYDLTTWDPEETSAEFYRYDDATTHNLAPAEGNLTNYLVWTGIGSGPTQRAVNRLTYDDWGNVVTEMDAANGTTTHAYDTSKHLFRTSTTNALGHVTQTAWNFVCQVPSSQTDANALVTSFAYDVHCRETQRDYPNGQYLKTGYYNIGNPATQFVRTEELSAGSTAGKAVRFKYQYINGLGEVWKTASSGDTNATANMIAVLTDYDARGNVASTSLPLTWAAALAGTTTYKTSFSYDALNRPTKTSYANGNYETVDYTHKGVTRYGGTVQVPTIHMQDPQCYDAASSTLCMERWDLADWAGRLIRTDRQDTNITDYGSTVPGRSTNYDYDLLGRLIDVYDPNNVHFAYTYDVYGNRIEAKDPGLGVNPTTGAGWLMTYDTKNNLIGQTDAKGQPITFTYDLLNRVKIKTVGTGTTRVETRYTYDEVRSNYYNTGGLTTQELWTPSQGTIHSIAFDYHKNGQVQETRHTLDGKAFTLRTSFRADGQPEDLRLPSNPGTTNIAWLGQFQYDAASRLTAWPGYITAVDYSNPNSTQILWPDKPVRTDFANGSYDIASYGTFTGMIGSVEAHDSTGAIMARAGYARTASGRIWRSSTSFVQNGVTEDQEGNLDYTYDYAGRLLNVAHTNGQTAYNQSFTYDAAGRMRSNSQVGTYAYGNTGKALHAPSSVTPAPGPAQTLAYDANGNMTAGLDGKVMTYDGENRPLSVSYAGRTTTYVYGADGARLKKIETDPVTQQSEVTLYMGPVEIRKYGQGNAEEILLYPHPNIRIVKTKNASGQVVTKVNTLHLDGLGSVRAVTNEAGLATERTAYRPFGEETPLTPVSALSTTSRASSTSTQDTTTPNSPCSSSRTGGRSHSRGWEQTGTATASMIRSMERIRQGTLTTGQPKMLPPPLTAMVSRTRMIMPRGVMSQFMTQGQTGTARTTQQNLRAEVMVTMILECMHQITG